MEKLTEQSSRYTDLEKQSVGTLLRQINQEDRQVALAVQQALPQIEAFVEAVVPRMENGGRLVYIGAGTSGGLGGVDQIGRAACRERVCQDGLVSGVAVTLKK